jgi:protein-tyrosine phosphatase
VSTPPPSRDLPGLPSLEEADASFVTERLLVGGDLGTHDEELAGRQLKELVDAGVTHVIDTRIEWDDQAWVAERSPDVVYRHHGMDDAGQEVPFSWFDEAVGSALEAIEAGGVVLAHCHMGVNRGPSLGLAVLLAQGWDVIDALDAIRAARPIAWVAYAEDALRWHHDRQGSSPDRLRGDLIRLARWREANELDLREVIRTKREAGW